MMCFFYRRAKVNGRKQSEHISLNKCNKHFHQTYKYVKGY